MKLSSALAAVLFASSSTLAVPIEVAQGNNLQPRSWHLNVKDPYAGYGTTHKKREAAPAASPDAGYDLDPRKEAHDPKEPRKEAHDPKEPRKEPKEARKEAHDPREPGKEPHDRKEPRKEAHEPKEPRKEAHDPNQDVKQ